MENNISKYTLYIQKKAEKFLEKLSEPDYSLVKSVLISLSDNPRPFGYKKLKGLEVFRVRAGNYRIIYEIIDEVLIVDVINIGHRKNIYK